MSIVTEDTRDQEITLLRHQLMTSTEERNELRSAVLNLTRRNEALDARIDELQGLLRELTEAVEAAEHENPAIG